MQKQLVIDSSTLFAFEKARLLDLLGSLSCQLIVPAAVKEEIEVGDGKPLLNFVKVMPLKGRSLKLSRSLAVFGIGNGEAECCALAFRLKLGFIVCNDRKFIRQRFFSSDEKIKSIKLFGFSFLLYQMYKQKLIPDVWNHFDKIILANHWGRSEVHVSNHTFLKEMGFSIGSTVPLN